MVFIAGKRTVFLNTYTYFSAVFCGIKKYARKKVTKAFSLFTINCAVNGSD